MHLNRRRLALSAVLAAVMAGGVLLTTSGRPAAAQQGTRPIAITLFRGELGGDSNLSLNSWGSGSAEPSKEAVLSGSTSIKVTTHGMYQGARLDFRDPVDLNDAVKNPNAYMRFRVRFTGDQSSQTSFDPSGQQSRNAASPFKEMRFLLVMADGTRYELVRPVEVPVVDANDPTASFIPMAFPFAAITKKLDPAKLPTGDGAKLKQIAIFGDKYQQFYIGEIGIITDETDINVTPLDDQIFFAQQQTTFAGSAEGGASTLKYSWDFDATDGIQEDAVGRVVTHIFPKSGAQGGQKKYAVTLTVSDVDGLKKPQTVKLEAEVND